MPESEDAELQQWVELARMRWLNEILPQNNEHVIHEFLSEHAGLFLTRDPWEGIIISKLKLSSQYETDFVVVRDEYSEGFVYTFFEIEIPDVKLFTKPQKPGDRLNTALAQVNSWRRWLQQHPREALDLLPSKSVRYDHPPRYEFCIIIGRRDDDIGASSDRGWLSQYNDIRIRSFDSLTANANWPWSHLGPASQYPRRLEKELSRRDWRAITHSEWVGFVKGMGVFDFHLYERHWQKLLALRRSGRPEAQA